MCRFLDADTTLSSLLLDGYLTPSGSELSSAPVAPTCGRAARTWRWPAGWRAAGGRKRRVAPAAMRLEEYWNELQRELPFSLLCGYHIDGSPDSTDLDPIRHVHTYVG